MKAEENPLKINGNINTVKFSCFTESDYRDICTFLIELCGHGTANLNWNWARFEWMYQHPYCDRAQLGTIGLWKDNGRVVGAAIFDLYHGEAFCASLPEYESLLPEIYGYASKNLSDENGLGVCVADTDKRTQAILESLGFKKAEQTEQLFFLDLEDIPSYTLQEGLTIRPIALPEEKEAYNTVIWKGFDHEGDMEELETMRRSTASLPPNLRTELCLAVDDGSEFAAHCCCWYDARTDYAYIEPVCTIPKYRGKGIGRAVLLEALDRCRDLGAKRAIVLSDQTFYQKLGFKPLESYTFYWKK